MNSIKLSALAVLAFTLSACGVDMTDVDNGPTDETGEALSTKGKFETFEGKDGKTYFHLLAGNGEKVLASQGYTTLESANNGIASVKTNGTDASKFLLREASDGAWYFVVTAANNQIIAISEMYATQSSATRGMTATAAVVRATIEKSPAATNDARFEIFKGLDSKYYFHVRALNGEIVIQSQSYTSKAAAINGADSVNTNGGDATKYTVLPAADGQWYFTLKAGNGAIIGRSETYPMKSNAQRAVAASVDLLQLTLRK